MERQNQKLFEQNYVKFREHIYWYIYKKTGKKELAEDLTADTFIKLFEHPEVMRDRDENGIKAWLFTVSRNKLYDSYRKKSVSKGKVDVEDEIFEIIASDDVDYIGELISEENSKQLIQSFSVLSVEEKEILELRYKEEMKFSEIGEIVGKKEGAVKMLLYRAMEKLKEELEGKI